MGRRGASEAGALVKKLSESFPHETNVLIKGSPRDGSGGRSLSVSLFSIFIHLCAWLCWVSVVAHRIFITARGLSSCSVQAQ